MTPNLPVLATIDPDLTERLVSRRDALRRAALAAAAFGSVPVFLGALSKEAFGQGGSLPSGVVDVLRFALTLEHLENDFYIAALGVNGLIPAADRAIFETIQDHEQAHVDFLAPLVPNYTKPQFDFSGGNGSGNGPFATALTNNYTLLKAAAQVFEDTGVRAYKGQVTNLTDAPDVLTAALTIHSVEGRHAAAVRYLRMLDGASVQPWTTLAQPGFTPPAGTEALIAQVYGAGSPAASFPSEANTTQAGVNLTTVMGIGANLSAETVSEAFDEPLNMDAVLTIVAPFIVGSNP